MKFTKTRTLFQYMLPVFLLLAAGNVRATVWTVTASGDTKKNVALIEGSLRDVLTTKVQNGDTVRFADNLATETINLVQDLSVFGSAAKAKDSTLTLIGNGVTIASAANYSLYFASMNIPMTELEMENMRFSNAGAIMCAGAGHIRNCSFEYKDAMMIFLTVAGQLSVEGCFFSVDNPTANKASLLIGNTTKDVSFVSCTFFKAAGSYSPNNSFFSDAVTLTNCVMMDNSSKATFGVAPASNGYNVIRASSGAGAGVLAGFTVAGDTVMPLDDALPLTLDGGVWKVPLAGPAYRRLSPQSVLSEIDALRNVTFPPKDLSGEGIDYTCKTHSGAWQQVYLEAGETEPAPECDGVAVTDITLAPPAGIIYTETGAYTITAAIAPADASPVVTWTSSDETVAAIAADGNSAAIITPLKAGTTTITATSVATPTVTASVEIEVRDYIHVAGIELTPTLQFYNYMVNEKRISYRITPDNALNKNITWTLYDPTGTLNVNTTSLASQNQVYFTFKESAMSLDLYETSGTATLTARTEDGNYEATCTINIGHGNFADGVLLVCEGRYPGKGAVNYLHPDGSWEDNIWYGGITKQFGAIYKDYFVSVSKQNSDLSIVNAATLNTDIHSCKQALSDGDPRAFVGVDEHTGYLSTSNGIYVFSLDFGTELEIAPTGHVTGSEGVGGEGNESDGAGPLYQGQTGTMVRAGAYVFALHQTKGLLVIDPAAHRVVRTIDGAFNGLVLAADGNLWSGAGGAKLWRIDPWTLDVAEVSMTLPAGAAGPAATAWAAWRIESLMADPVGAGLYWGAGGGDGSRFGPAYFYRYDIDAGTVARVLDLTAYDNNRWRSYGPAYGLHPVTGEMYVAVYTGNGNKDYRVLKFDPAAPDVITGDYPMSAQYWFPAAVVFPDVAAPLVDASFPAAVTFNAAHRQDTLALRPLVSDADQMPAAIVKTIEAIGDATLIDAFIRRDTLFITPLKDVAAAQKTTVALKFNSNGKVVDRRLDVTVEPGAIAHPVTSVALNHTTAELAVGETLALAASVAPANADNQAVVWTSDKPHIASVDDNGTVTAHLAPGTAVITVATVQGGFTATCAVATKAAGQPAVPATGVALNRTTAELTVGATLQLTATVSPANATNKAATWTSSAPAVASVDNNGVVEAHLAPGAAIITATTADGGFTATCVVATKVADPVETNPFELNQHSLTLYPGQTVTLGLTAPQHFNVTWSSSASSVATVTQTGEVRSIGAGVAVVTARDAAKNKADVCTVTVLPLPSAAVESVTLNTSFLTLAQGETATLQATVSPGLAGQPLTWSASNPGVADVTAGGMVIAFAPGSSVIRVAAGAWSATCTVQVSAPRAKTEVDHITQTGAQLYLSTIADASYYLIHLYTKRDVSLVPVYTLKVAPDGTVSFVTLRAGGNLVVPLSYLSPATSYILEVETIRETQGKADVTHTEIAAFTTASPTDNEALSGAQPKVAYANGILRLENLDGYNCAVTSASGQHTHAFRVVSPDERRRIALKQGIYILSAQKSGVRKAFKFAVF